MAPRKKILPNTIPLTPPSGEELQKHLDELNKKVPKKKKKLPQASPELWPGESTDLGGFGIA